MVSLSAQQDKAVFAVRDWYGSAKKRQDFTDVDLASIDTDIKADKFYLGGYAGSGKTTILPHIIDLLNLTPASVAFAAPTGKAARVMTTKLKGFGMNATASTIHSLIYVPNRELIESKLEERDELDQKRVEAIGSREVYRREGNNDSADRMTAFINDLKEKIKTLDKELDKLYKTNDGPSFSLNPGSRVTDKSLIVIDEASMVGDRMADDLRSFGVPVLAIGDPGQLPPVEGLPGLCVDTPDFFLDEIHRQAADNPIIRLSQDVRNGKTLKPYRSPCGRVDIVTRRNDDATYNLDRTAQILVGTNKRRWQLTAKIRAGLGYERDIIGDDERLIICKNSRRFPDLINGTFVYSTQEAAIEEGEARVRLKVEDEDGKEFTFEAAQGLFEETYLKQKNAASCERNAAFRAKKDCEHVDFGHVITCHKSQGSQWDDVIVHDESGVFRNDAAKWAYTAVTRAAERLTVVL